MGRWKSKRSFLYIDDCIDASINLFNSSFRGPVNIGSEELVSINEMIDILEHIANKKFNKKYLLDKPKGVKGRNSDNTLIKKELSWEPKYSLSDGLKKTYYWIEEQIKKMKNKYLNLYFNKINSSLFTIDEKIFHKSVNLIKNLKKKNKIIFVGNGGSASIANHCSTDFSKFFKKRSMTFNEPNLITCYANDYGHENWMKEALKTYGDKNDLLCLISSSGQSKNILKCADQAKKMGLKIITFSGFWRLKHLKKERKFKFLGKL